MHSIDEGPAQHALPYGPYTDQDASAKKTNEEDMADGHWLLPK